MIVPRVLVPLDGSPLSEAIFPVLLGLGGARVTLLRVLEEGPRDARSRDHLEAGLALTEAADRLRARGVEHVEPLVRTGDPREMILRVAAEEGARLIALTTHGRTGFDRLVLGSVAERVLRASTLPVLALRATEPAPPAAPPVELFREVLVPHDGSELAGRALEVLAWLGAGGRGRITLLGVVEAEVGGERALGAAPPSDLIARYRRMQVEDVREHLGRAASCARELGLTATVDHGVGRPAAKIIDRAIMLGATLIAMGSHGRSGISRWALGSVAERVLHAAGVPVLICK